MLVSLAIMFPSNAFAAVSESSVIDFAESLAISGKPLEMKLPKNMVFLGSKSQVDCLVFVSSPKGLNKITYHKGLVEQEDSSKHIAAIAEYIESNYDNMVTHDIKSKFYNGKIGKYQISRATFSYYDHGQATAVSIASFRDSKRVVTVVVESKQKTMSQSVAKSKKLAKEALFFERQRAGYDTRSCGVLSALDTALSVYWKARFLPIFW